MKTKGTKSKKIKLPYGDGSIYYVESRKQYSGQINLVIDGERIRKTVYGKTERETRNKLKELQIQALAGNLHNEKKQQMPTVFQYAEKMMDEQLALNEIRQSSYDRKMETLKMLSAISDKPLNELSEDDIIAFFKTQLDYSQSCINKMYQLLGAVLSKATNRKIIEDNPIKEIKCPKSNKKTIPVRALTVYEQKKLLEVLKNEDIRYSDIMLLSMFTGMRIGECCALMVEDINLDDRTISVNKTVARGKFGKNVFNETKTSAGTRTLFVNEDVSDFLRTIIGRKKSGLLFLSRNQNLVTTNQVNYSYSAALKAYEIVDNTVYGRVDLHSLRHTYATRCIESGMPAKVLQKILGHTDINITLNTYCSVFEKFRNEHLAVADEYMKANNLQIA
ncbi:MAG: tyrosine-type recombinase/integrase [Ruminococcus sp.]|nr:tyrosine-type recombinase/integrase [Ruminococcus sp.]